MANLATAIQFIDELKKHCPPDALRRLAAVRRDSNEESRIGMRMGDVFVVARQMYHMEPSEIEKLLESPVYEVRMGAVNVMSNQVRDKATPAERKKELYDLYLRRHDRINTWSMVDASADYVVGGYLADKSRDILAKLAKSKNPFERRTAMMATFFFVRAGDTAETFKIADILAHDSEQLVQKSVGWILREAGKKDEPGLTAFLDKHAATMPRLALRSAIEKLEPKTREHYMKLKDK